MIRESALNETRRERKLGAIDATPVGTPIFGEDSGIPEGRTLEQHMEKGS